MQVCTFVYDEFFVLFELEFSHVYILAFHEHLEDTTRPKGKGPQLSKAQQLNSTARDGAAIYFQLEPEFEFEYRTSRHVHGAGQENLKIKIQNTLTYCIFGTIR